MTSLVRGVVALVSAGLASGCWYGSDGGSQPIVECPSGTTRPEVEACDGLDNNCNGVVDEGCDCRHAATRWCNGGAGMCMSGEQTCGAGSWGPCVPVQSAGTELCDGIDNDCDGVVDDGFNLDTPCDSIGRCPQTRVCGAGGTSSLCADDERLFSAEHCDGIDNDCDGLVDRIADSGSLRSVCECRERTLTIGTAANASIEGNLNLCEPTGCAGDKPRGLLVDGRCYPGCQRANSDPDGDGWGFENGVSCLVETSPRGLSAAPCDGIPLGLTLTYCLSCSVSDDLPYALCQSVPRFDLRAFGRGELWLRVDYTYAATGPAKVPVNLWFHAGEDRRKHLPLVRLGDLPGRHQTLLRVQESCFTASAAFGSDCPESGERCAHCGGNEVCGAITECGDYDLSQAWLQVAAEFCERGSGQQRGTVTVHRVELVEPNCQQ
jgi:hypothetical protein